MLTTFYIRLTCPVFVLAETPAGCDSEMTERSPRTGSAASTTSFTATTSAAGRAHVRLHEFRVLIYSNIACSLFTRHMPISSLVENKTHRYGVTDLFPAGRAHFLGNYLGAVPTASTNESFIDMARKQAFVL